MEVDEGSSKNQTSSPTGWLQMPVWRMRLRRTNSTIISWACSFLFLSSIVIILFREKGAGRCAGRLLAIYILKFYIFSSCLGCTFWLCDSLDIFSMYLNIHCMFVYVGIYALACSCARLYLTSPSTILQPIRVVICIRYSECCSYLKYLLTDAARPRRRHGIFAYIYAHYQSKFQPV